MTTELNASVAEEGTAFYKRMLEQANPNVLRLALYHSTRDPALAKMSVTREPFWGGAFQVATLEERHVGTVREKALDFLERGARDEAPAPSETELHRMMEMLYGAKVSDYMYKLGRGDLVEDEFPLGVEWTSEPSEAVKKSFFTIIIGAGLAGMNAAIQLDRLGLPYVVIERNSGVGGTWWVNDYPEARVDIASHHYQYSFMKKYPWKHYFATQPELKEYAEEVARRYDLMRKIRLDTELVAAKWDQATQTWNVTVRGRDGAEDMIVGNAIISAAGLFNAPNMPDIPGIDTFQGKMFHTTQWDHGYDYAGKRVGQIGVGSTGAQLMPEVARRAAQVTVFQRSPQWVSEIPGYRDPVSEEVQWLMDNFPHYWGWFSYFTAAINIGDPEGLQNYDREWQANGGLVSERNDNIRKHNIAYINSKVGHRPDLVEKLTPTDIPFAKRPVVDNGWFDALNRDNVSLVTDPIKRITPDGVLMRDGAKHKFDLLLICAGFKAEQYLWPVEYQGLDGMTLEQAWAKDGPRAYLGCTLKGFPNLFVVLGPNGQARGGGLIKWGELWSGYALRSIVALLESGNRSMSIKPEVFEAYNERLDEALKDCVWVTANSYYVSKSGRQIVNMPWKPAEYFEWITNVDLLDYELRKNYFSELGQDQDSLISEA